MKKTLVLGASANAERYSNRAVRMLVAYGHDVIALGNRADKIADIQILTGQPKLDDIDTVSIYLSAANQQQYEDYILGLKPKRIIFNPGAENDKLADIAEEADIEVIEGCTLVMLQTGQF
jgi:predicted CoA-binding protein